MFSGYSQDVLRMFSGCSEMVSGCPRIFAKVQVGRSIQSGGYAYNTILFHKINAFSDVFGCWQIFSNVLKCSQVFAKVQVGRSIQSGGVELKQSLPMQFEDFTNCSE